MSEPSFDLVGLMKRLLHKPRRPPRASRPAHPYHAVSIRHGKNPCAAAKALGEQRFLAKDAPRLPLPECDAERCGCAFAHHEDRRDEGRRAEDHDEKPRPFSGHNARTGIPRRRSDNETAFDDQYFDHVGRRDDDTGKS
jgi:hypothetical protein